MGVIYKEVIRNKKVSIVKGLFLIVLFTFVTNVAANSVGYSSKYEIELGFILLADALLAAIMIKMFYDIAYVNRVCYSYKLIDRELIFEKVIGNSGKVILSVDSKDIEELLPLTEAKGLKDTERTYRFLCHHCKSSIFCCTVNHKGRRIKFYFQPSDELIRKLKNVMIKES